MTGAEPRGDRPLLLVVRGTPDPAELAALTAVAELVSRSAPPRLAPGPGPWADPARRHRPTPRPGPGAWARSAGPGR